MKLDIEQVRSVAAGHWQQILPALTGIDGQLLDGRNHPCVRCGGTDRFRMVNIERGALFCNQCNNAKNGDGFAAVQWLTGVTFGDAIREVAEFLNIIPAAKARPARVIPFNPLASPVKFEKPATSYPTCAAAIRVVDYVMGKDGNKFGGRWNYHDATGNLVASVLRYNRPDGGKEFRPVSRHGNEWFIKGPPEPRPLYRLDKIICTSSDQSRYVVEGEKAADAAALLFGLNSTTSMNGARSPEKTDWTPLRGKRVIILPDNDEPGRGYAMAVTTILHGLNCSVRIVDLPGLPPGGDIADWDGTREELIRLCGLTS